MTFASYIHRAAGRRCRKALATLLLILLLLPGAPVWAASLQGVIESDPRLSIFAGAMKATDLWTELAARERVTVFVPSDQALKAEGSAFLLEKVLLTERNSGRLHDVLSNHVYLGQRLSPDDIGMLELVADNGACFLVSRVGTGIRVGPQAVVTEFVSTENGSLFVIDRLLWRPWTGEDHCHES